MEFVGVKNQFDLIFAGDKLGGLLKQEALMLDRIAIPDFSLVLEGKDRRDNLLRFHINDLVWLYEQGIIFEPEDVLKIKLNVENEELNTYHHAAIHLFIDLKHLERQRYKIRRKYNFTEMGYVAVQWQTRATCLYLREVKQIDACSVFSHICQHMKLEKAKDRNVLDIVFRALPVPDEQTSWEHILEYRRDPDSHSKFLALRNWMNDVSRTDLTPIEIEQKLEFLIDQYRRHIELHKMKVNIGALETVVVSTAEILENLVKFKWGNLAKSLFAFKQRKVSLLENELTAPGNEVAYIVKAKDTFIC